ncbi:hypothetical protein L1887_62177 [Cichorium endivia]|nr:hypothetical protein L1887_62177 [Cichorium endivia]
MVLCCSESRQGKARQGNRHTSLCLFRSIVAQSASSRCLRERALCCAVLFQGRLDQCIGLRLFLARADNVLCWAVSSSVEGIDAASRKLGSTRSNSMVDQELLCPNHPKSVIGTAPFTRVWLGLVTQGSKTTHWKQARE